MHQLRSDAGEAFQPPALEPLCVPRGKNLQSIPTGRQAPPSCVDPVTYSHSSWATPRYVRPSFFYVPMYLRAFQDMNLPLYLHVTPFPRLCSKEVLPRLMPAFVGDPQELRTDLTACATAFKKTLNGTVVPQCISCGIWLNPTCFHARRTCFIEGTAKLEVQCLGCGAKPAITDQCWGSPPEAAMFNTIIETLLGSGDPVFDVELPSAIQGKAERRQRPFCSVFAFIKQDPPMDELLDLFLGMAGRVECGNLFAFVLIDTVGRELSLISMRDGVQKVLSTTYEDHESAESREGVPLARVIEEVRQTSDAKGGGCALFPPDVFSSNPDQGMASAVEFLRSEFTPADYSLVSLVLAIERLTTALQDSPEGLLPPVGSEITLFINKELRQPRVPHQVLKGGAQRSVGRVRLGDLLVERTVTLNLIGTFPSTGMVVPNMLQIVSGMAGGRCLSLCISKSAVVAIRDFLWRIFSTRRTSKEVTHGSNVYMKLRCSKSFKPRQLISPWTDLGTEGGGLLGSVVSFRVPSLSSESSFCVDFTQNEDLDSAPAKRVYFQAVLRYYPSRGPKNMSAATEDTSTSRLVRRRVRVITMGMEITQAMSTAYRFVDSQALVAGITKSMALRLMAELQMGQDDSCRERLNLLRKSDTDKMAPIGRSGLSAKLRSNPWRFLLTPSAAVELVCTSLFNYRLNCAPGRLTQTLILPSGMTTAPLQLLGGVKAVHMGKVVATVGAPFQQIFARVAPRMFRVLPRNLEDPLPEGALSNDLEELVGRMGRARGLFGVYELPPEVDCISGSLRKGLGGGIFLLWSGDTAALYVSSEWFYLWDHLLYGLDSDPINSPVEPPDVEEETMTAHRDRLDPWPLTGLDDTAFDGLYLGQKVARVISTLQKFYGTPEFPQVIVTAEGASDESEFMCRLTMDAMLGWESYNSFLASLHYMIKAKYNAI